MSRSEMKYRHADIDPSVFCPVISVPLLLKRMPSALIEQGTLVISTVSGGKYRHRLEVPTCRPLIL